MTLHFHSALKYIAVFSHFFFFCSIAVFRNPTVPLLTSSVSGQDELDFVLQLASGLDGTFCPLAITCYFLQENSVIFPYNNPLMTKLANVWSSGLDIGLILFVRLWTLPPS